MRYISMFSGIEAATVAQPIMAGGPVGGNQGGDIVVTHSLRGEGFDASEDGTGRGTPLVPVAIQERAVSENLDAGPQGKGWQEDCSYTLEARNKVQAVAFGLATQQEPKWAEELCPTLQVPSKSGGGQPHCVAFSAKDHGGDAMDDCSPTLRAATMTSCPSCCRI